MSKLGKTILSSLEQMEADIEGAKLLGMVRQRKPMTHNILPEGFKYITETPEERVVLPIMTVNISGRAVRLEISPAAEPEVWWANIFCQVDKPAINFKMTRREALPWFSRGFMAAGLDDFLLGDPDIDEKYAFASTNVAGAKAALLEGSRLQQLSAFRNLEHMTLDNRFARINCSVREEEDAAAEALLANINRWVGLVKDMETWGRETAPEAQT